MATRQSFHDQVENLRRDLLRMGILVTTSLEKAVQSLARLDGQLAREVIDGDDVVDQMLLDIQHDCLQLLALQQPMARDLRTIGSALKVVTDLERMADHATDIAKITLQLEGQRLIKRLVHIPRMVRLVDEMTREALEAYVNRDAERARTMIAMDDEVDDEYRQTFDEMLAIMQSQPENVRQATYILLAALYLERVADHATNLGEWTIYQVTGELRNMNP